MPPIAEQAEYHLFQRDKVELQMPELYHKIGKCLSLYLVFFLNIFINIGNIEKYFTKSYSEDPNNQFLKNVFIQTWADFIEVSPILDEQIQQN